MQIYVLYPERYWVDEKQVKSWAADALVDYENKHVEPESLDIDEAIEIATEYCDITFSNKRRIKTNVEKQYIWEVK